MKNLIQIFCLAGMFLFISIEANYAQTDSSTIDKKCYWLNFGIGKGSVGDESMAIATNFSYQFGKNLVSLRAAGNIDWFRKSMSDYGILYGRSLNQSSLFVSVGAGLALVEGSISHGLFSNKEPEKIGPTIGIPFEAQLFWRPTSFLGIGLYGFANLNSEETFYGFTLNLQFGKLR
jgi:hypothetical protein